MDRWLENKARDGVKPNTLRTYQDAARLAIVPSLGRIKLAKLRPLDVENMLSRYAKAGKSPAWAAYKLRVLKMSLKQAVRWDMVPRNVAEAIKAPRQTQREMSVWMPEEADRFLKCAEPHRLYAAFYTTLMTGMRRGELLGLRWADVDLDQSRLHVRHNLIEVRVDAVPGKRHAGKETVSAVEVRLTTPKTAGSRRTILLSAGTVRELRAHRERQAVERRTAGSAWADDDFVFASPLGGHTDPRTFYGWYLALCLTSGVRRIRFHDLRHTAASLMIRRGIPPKTVSERLGHADVAFTLRVYTHLYDEQKEEAAFDLADLIADEKVKKAEKEKRAKKADQDEPDAA